MSMYHHSNNVIGLRRDKRSVFACGDAVTWGETHSQPAFKVAHLAAGGSQVKDASGGPAGGQTFEKFDKQVLLDFIETLAKVLTLRNEGRGHSQYGGQGIIPIGANQNNPAY